MIRLYTGDVLKCLAKLPDESVQCVVTSPPYWGLRDYGVAGQLGLEPTPEAFVAGMVAVFAEVRRVLRPDGTCWVNLGDSYGPDKQEQMIPHRVAIALQADGWICRSTIIWHKPNPMPESVRDRPTKSHEYLFLLTKRARYYYDADAVRETAQYGRQEQPKNIWDRCKINGVRVPGTTRGSDPSAGRNARSVWTITPKPFRGAHFATFPPALVERCVKAGTSERGACPTCGAPWDRVVKREKAEYRPCNGDWMNSHLQLSKGQTRSQAGGMPRDQVSTLGWHPSCSCPDAEPVPCVVLDPFSGAGTVALVADQLGRNAIGIDLNPKYNSMARKRIAAAQALQAGVV